MPGMLLLGVTIDIRYEYSPFSEHTLHVIRLCTYKQGDLGNKQLAVEKTNTGHAHTVSSEV